MDNEGAGRRDEIAANLRVVREQIADACIAAGRDPGEVTLVAVTKTYPASDVAHLAALGVTDVGENRDQEAAPKAAEVTDAVRWHFVGQLQRNKCKSVVSYADVVHSVDGVRLATALSEAARRHREHPVDVLVQVSLDGDPSRGGAVNGHRTQQRDQTQSGDQAQSGDPTRGVGPSESGYPTQGGPVEKAGGDAELDRVLAAVAGAELLRLRGLMAVAPVGWEPERAFGLLAELAAKVRAEYPQATALSAGMSGDFALAIRYGATLVRIGSALLGNRPTLM